MKAAGSDGGGETAAFMIGAFKLARDGVTWKGMRERDGLFKLMIWIMAVCHQDR
jgi:hypothetical protein